MRIIPVLDVLGGRVVRAVGGRRGEYRPVVSRLTDSTEPTAVARRLLEVTGAKELYVADLDAIVNPPPAPDPTTVDATDPVYQTQLSARVCDAFPRTRVLFDAGVRTETDVLRLAPYRPGRRVPVFGWRTWVQRTNLVPVVGTETVETAGGWQAVAHEFQPLLALSVDLMDGRWLGRWEPWREWGVTADSHVLELVEAGMSALGAITLILLDLAAVGEARGPQRDLERWLRAVRDRYAGGEPRETFAGGGVRNRDDVKRLEDAGADAVLVASALHDGTLP